jgi:hypothetical protein
MLQLQQCKRRPRYLVIETTVSTPHTIYSAKQIFAKDQAEQAHLFQDTLHSAVHSLLPPP